MNSRQQDIARLMAVNRPLFEALGDATRQEILIILTCEKRLTVGELTMHLHVSRPAVSHHLRILKNAGLLNEVKEGVRRYYHPTFRENAGRLAELIDAIRQERELF